MSHATFKDIVERKNLKSQPSKAEISDSSAIKAGRVSVAEDAGTIGGLIAEMSAINPDFNIELITAIETLAKYNADVSYAVDNIRQLGNTKYHVYFDDSVGDDEAKEMRLRIKNKSKTWYAYSGGLNSVVNDLLTQIAITGALSAENAISEDLSGVKKVVVLPPKNIRFKYDDAKDEYAPYQLVRRGFLTADGNMVKLNTVTYKYIAMNRFGEKPYAMPPFLSALENVAIGRDMQEGLKSVVKKLGVLGFLEVLVKAPKAKPNEAEEAYYRRTESYLSRVVPEIEKGVNKGYVVGYKDQHEFKMNNTNGNVQGGKDLIEMNDIKTMAGLKQDPLMFGRNFSTTETLGRVILAKMTTQVGNYQKIVATYLESLFLTDLQLAGYNIQALDVEFDPPMVGDKNREEEAYGKKIANLDSLLNRGVIDIFQYATELGYEKPADPAKHKITPNDSESKSNTDDNDNDSDDPTDPKTTAANKFNIGLNLYADNKEYNYGSNCCSKEVSMSFDKADDDLSYFIKAYYAETKATFDAATKKVVAKVGKVIAGMSENATEEEVFDAVIYELYRTWGGVFKKPQAKIVSKFVSAAYQFFRKDISIFGKDSGKAPKASFDAVDTRVMEYFKRSDELYLGKFITDEDIRKKMSAFIHDKYLTRELPIGNNTAAMEAFRNEFGGLIELQDWKIRRIIDTTVSKLRSTASAKYMEQAEVEYYEVRGVNDRLQCAHCSSMQGKKFKVYEAVKHIEQFSISDPAYVPLDSPFVNEVFKKAEEINNLSGEQLQSKGIHLTPFHPHCRDTVVAIL